MYHVWQSGNARIIEVNDNLDIASSSALASAVDKGMDATKRFGIVSLERCSFCDSTGLDVLVKAKKQFGQKLKMVLPRANQMNRVFDVTALTTHFGTVRGSPRSNRLSKRVRLRRIKTPS